MPPRPSSHPRPSSERNAMPHTHHFSDRRAPKASSSSSQASPPYPHSQELTNYIHALVQSVLPTQAEYEAKENARLVLEKLVQRISSGAKLLPFGSMANGFALKNSDMDLCCFMGHDAALHTPSEMVEILGRLIEQETSFYVKTLPRARIPIIKLTIPTSPANSFSLACDIGFENRLALENTRLLLTYAMVDPRVRTIVLFLKVWTKRRTINNPYRGTLSSYGYVLLVIYFLAHVKRPPVLPNLQRLPPSRATALRDLEFQGHDILFYDNLDRLPEIWTTSNTESVGELVLEFFRYFSKDFLYGFHVVSIRSETGLLMKDAKGWQSDVEHEPDTMVRDQHKLCIEDPFQLDYNVARTVTRDGLYTIRGEFMRAFRILALRSQDRFSSSIEELCEEREEYLVPHPPVDRATPRRRSAPSPRLFPVNPPISYPVPPTSITNITELRAWAVLQAVHDSSFEDVDGGIGPAFASTDPEFEARASRVKKRTVPVSTTESSTYLPTVKRPSFSFTRPPAILERRSSWDGPELKSIPQLGVYNLHRTFQDLPEGGPGPRASTTAPSSPDLGSVSRYNSFGTALFDPPLHQTDIIPLHQYSYPRGYDCCESEPAATSLSFGSLPPSRHPTQPYPPAPDSNPPTSEASGFRSPDSSDQERDRSLGDTRITSNGVTSQQGQTTRLAVGVDGQESILFGEISVTLPPISTISTVAAS